MTDITLTAAIESLGEANDRIDDALATIPITAPTDSRIKGRPDPAAWLKEAETDIANARRALARDEAKIADLQDRCSEHRLDIKVHEARADGARRGIAALQPRQGRKVGK